MKNVRILLGVCLLAVLALGVARAAEEPYPNVPWTSLFNGKDLTGWSLAPMNGTAKYEARDGAIVGTTVAKSPNSFLKSDKPYGNFVLEYEFKVDPKMNSGVQIRSWGWPEHNKGRFHGYQIEIDPSSRAWSAGVYDEARRAWIYTLADKPEAGKAFKQNDWNKIRVSFIGNHLQTWINGVAAADLHDSLTPAGCFGLQVHAGAPDHQIMWRNLRIKDLDRVQPNAGPEGPWKGATSDASAGIYAKVVKAGDGFTAKIYPYDNPEMEGKPLAELQGKAEGELIKFTGGDWSGELKDGLFTGKGKVTPVDLKATMPKDGAYTPASGAKKASAKVAQPKAEAKGKGKGKKGKGAKKSAAPAAAAPAGKGPVEVSFVMMPGACQPAQ